MPLPKLTPVPRAPEEAAAAAIAQVIRGGYNAKGLAMMLSFDADGRKMLTEAAALNDPEELIKPFEESPAAWQHLKGFDRATLTTFAHDFIQAAKEQTKK